MLEIIENGAISERNYFLEIAAELQKKELPCELSLVLNDAKQPLPASRFRKIVFTTSLETHDIADCCSQARDVLLNFRNYYPLSPHQDQRMRPLPLGYQGGFKPLLPIKKSSQRLYDYFWTGATNCNRLALQGCLARYCTKNTNGKIVWYEGWSKGLPFEEYAMRMNESRITFAPRGWVSTESFRYFEACMSGCIIISEPKPSFWYYERAPHLWPGRWERVPELIDELLKDPPLLDQIQQYTLDYWQRCGSPRAVASYVREEVLKALGGTKL